MLIPSRDTFCHKLQVAPVQSAVLMAWLCGFLLYVPDNHGGSGLNLPQNLMAWGGMSVIALWCLIQRPVMSFPLRAQPDVGLILLLAGGILWSLPLLWSPESDWQLNAAARVAGLWGLLGLFMLLRRMRLNRKQRQLWLLILVISALLQGAKALWQLNLQAGRPYGSFQQVNVLASYLATGLACALFLFLRTRRAGYRKITAAALFILPALTVLLQSRAGWAGAVSAVVVLFFSAGRVRRGYPVSDRVLAAGLLLSGAAGGLIWLYVCPHFFPEWYFPAPDKASSTASRLYMLKIVCHLIQMHPLAGSGYGSFEALFGQSAALVYSGLEASSVTHPHNEILYAWVEGGLPALAGLLLMVAGVLKMVWSCRGLRGAGVALMLPLAIHINLEYPLYLSATHGLVLVVLMVLSTAWNNHQPQALSPEMSSGRIMAGVRVSGIVCSLLVMLFMFTGALTEVRLTAVERQGLLTLASDEEAVMPTLINPYSQYTRLDFDRHVALLLRFNITRDPALLARFRLWAERYLQVHNDPSVYHSLLMITRQQGLPEAESVCAAAHGRWPEDKRFVCAGE